MNREQQARVYKRAFDLLEEAQEKGFPLYLCHIIPLAAEKEFGKRYELTRKNFPILWWLKPWLNHVYSPLTLFGTSVYWWHPEKFEPRARVLARAFAKASK